MFSGRVMAARSLNQLNQDATGAFRVYERNQAAARAGSRLPVDQAKAAFAQSFQRGIYTSHFYADVVNAGTALRQKSSYRSVRAGCFQKFDPAPPGG